MATSNASTAPLPGRSARQLKILYKQRRKLERKQRRKAKALQNELLQPPALHPVAGTARKSSTPKTHPQGERVSHAPRPPKVSADAPEFLQSYAWRQLRMKVLMHYGARCQCCGATPGDGAVMNVDHIKPRKTHPHLALEFNNLQILCGDCNAGKGNWSQTDWRQNLLPVHAPQGDDEQAAVSHLRAILAG